MISKLLGVELPNKINIKGGERGVRAFLEKYIIEGDFADERVRNMMISIVRSVTTVDTRLDQLHTEMMGILKSKKYKGNLPEGIRKDFNTAIGTEDIEVDREAKEIIDRQQRLDIEAINSGDPNTFRQITPEEVESLIQQARKDNPTATDREIKVIAGNLYREILIEEANKLHEDATNKLLKEAGRKHKIKVVKALKKLEDGGHIELVQMVVNLRQVITELSEFIGGKDGANALSKELKIAFDITQGFYLSRSYRFFNDPTYRSNLIELLEQGKEVRGNKQKTAELEERIKNAVEDFKLIKRREVEGKLLTKKLELAQISGELTQERGQRIKESKEFKQEVDQELGNEDLGAKEAMIEYLKSFGDARNYESASEGAKVIHNALKKKKDLPPGVRGLLGQYESDADAITGIRVMLQTIQTQTHMLASIMKLKNLVDLDNRLREAAEAAGEKYDPIILSGKEHKKLPSQDQDNYEPMGDNVPKSNPLKGKFIRKDIKAGLDKSKDPLDMNRADATAKSYAGIVSFFSVLNGLALMFVTTVSGPAFHERNALGTIFKGLRAGVLVKPTLVWRLLYRGLAEVVITVPGVNEKFRYVPDWINRLVKGERVSLDSLRSEHAKLEALSVVNQNVKAAAYKDLFGLRKSSASFMADMEKLDSLNPVSRVFAITRKKVLDYLLKVTNASDNAFRIAMFHNNVAVLKKARRNGEGEFRGVPCAEMSDSYIDKEAAMMMNKITPGDDYLVQLGKTFSQTDLRIVLGSFSRFKFETGRTNVNYHRELVPLLKSSNPVIKYEGTKRLAGVLLLYGISYGAATSILSKLFGVDQEEQDALDEGNPSYYKRAQMIRMLNRETGEITDINFTYMDEQALIGDIISYAIKQVRKGEETPIEAAIGALQALAFGEFLDQQVFAEVVSEIKINRDPNGDKIVRDSDGSFDRIEKSIAYALKRLTPAFIRGSIEGKAAYDSAEGTKIEKMDAAKKVLIDKTFLPTKPYTAPLDSRYRSILYKYKNDKEFATGRQKAVLKEYIYTGRQKRKPTDEELREFANDYYEELTYLYDRTHNVTKSFFSLGMSPKEIEDALNSTGLMAKKDISDYLRGSTRSQLILRTRNLPLITDKDREDLQDLFATDPKDANRRIRFLKEARVRYTTEGFEVGTYKPKENEE
jgi:hypothetical protein